MGVDVCVIDRPVVLEWVGDVAWLCASTETLWVAASNASPMTNLLRLSSRASAASRRACTFGSARRTSALLAQRAVEAVEQIVRAAHAVGCAVVVIEVDALLDEAESRAGALATELERRERDGDRSVTDVHRIAPHDALVRDDVVIHRVVAML